MNNLLKILDAKIIRDPWDHLVVDNILSDSIFDKITQAAKILEPHAKKNHWAGLHLPRAIELGVDKETADIIIDLSNDLLEIMDQLKLPFNRFNKSTSGYFCMPKFAVTSSGCKYPIHTDSCEKSVALLIYVYPEKNIGTSLYRSEDKEDYSHTIEWKPNRAFIFCPYNNEDTWHNWENISSDSNRVTLKLEIGKVEDINNRDTTECQFDMDEILWLYDQFGQGNLIKN